VTIPKILIVHECPECHQRVKAAAEMRGEQVRCPACEREFHLPGPSSAAASQAALVAFVCPQCHAEVEAPEEIFDHPTPCPSCGQPVHFRHKLHFKDTPN